MRKKMEESTLRHLAQYVNTRSGMTLDKMFSAFDADADGCMDIDELVAMLKELKINVNN